MLNGVRNSGEAQMRNKLVEVAWKVCIREKLNHHRWVEFLINFFAGDLNDLVHIWWFFTTPEQWPSLISLLARQVVCHVIYVKLIYTFLIDFLETFLSKFLNIWNTLSHALWHKWVVEKNKWQLIEEFF